ncbi:hypothetical protein P43SY_011564 [Pythium insidiosum]|uniref:Glycosyl hydrolase family 81 N-terminal domain-containing protein n=1 Tax=Pythium insidiosum TaxID=114742 RepID=A0AAD5LPH1_PYTIN|nr:hypothetical protein P43SY_011564 [Pythium insidiosum]
MALSADRRRVEASKPYTGVLRVALAPTPDAFPFLIDSAPVFPVGGDVKYRVDDGNKDVATVEFHWKTRRFDGTAADKPLLMLALPHHVDSLAKGTTILSDVLYTSIRGMMTGVAGNVWTMKEDLPAVEWNYADEGLFAADQASSETATDARNRIIASLREDVAAYPTLSPDSTW